jgi:SNF2 family DNA or RNA helicase
MILNRSTEEVKFLNDIISHNKTQTPPIKYDSPLLPSRELLPHQERAFGRIIKMRNPADFSVPGSGKTTVALALFESLRRRGIADKLVVIGPLSSFAPWEEEFELCFGRQPKSIRITGDPSKRARIFSRIREFELILCSYPMAHQEESSIKSVLISFKSLLVLDEAHNIKRYVGGVWSETILRIAPFAARRMILTGTPAPRSLFDIWTQFTFLWTSQGLLGNRYDFETDLETGGEQDLQSKLSPLFHRVTKKELNLPEPEVKSILLKEPQWPPIQRKIIRLLELETISQINRIGLGEPDLATVRRWRRARMIRLM